MERDDEDTYEECVAGETNDGRRQDEEAARGSWEGLEKQSEGDTMGEGKGGASDELRTAMEEM